MNTNIIVTPIRCFSTLTPTHGTTWRSRPSTVIKKLTSPRILIDTLCLSTVSSFRIHSCSMIHRRESFTHHSTLHLNLPRCVRKKWWCHEPRFHRSTRTQTARSRIRKWLNGISLWFSSAVTIFICLSFVTYTFLFLAVVFIAQDFCSWLSSKCVFLILTLKCMNTPSFALKKGSSPCLRANCLRPFFALVLEL